MLVGMNVIVKENKDDSFVDILVEALKYIDDKTNIDVKEKLQKVFKK